MRSSDTGQDRVGSRQRARTPRLLRARDLRRAQGRTDHLDPRDPIDAIVDAVDGRLGRAVLDAGHDCPTVVELMAAIDGAFVGLEETVTVGRAIAAMVRAVKNGTSDPARLEAFLNAADLSADRAAACVAIYRLATEGVRGLEEAMSARKRGVR